MNFKKITALFAVALLLACSACAVAQTEQDNDYFRTLARTKELAKGPFVRALPCGKSTSGYEIPVLMVSDFSTDVKDKKRIILIAGQHGNEPHPIQAALDIVQQLSKHKHAKLLKKTCLIVVPMANPEGTAKHMRHNSRGIDMNRDWVSLSSKEALFIHKLIQTWKPHLLIDMHEWPVPAKLQIIRNQLVNEREMPEVVALPENSIELPYVYSVPQRKMMTNFAIKIKNSTGMHIIKCKPFSNESLFHRRYAKLGYSAILLETAHNATPEYKSSAYSNAVITAMNNITSDNFDTAVLSPASHRFDVASVIEFTKNAPEMIKKAAKDKKVYLISGLLCMAYSVIFFTKRKKKRPEKRLRIWKFRPHDESPMGPPPRIGRI